MSCQLQEYCKALPSARQNSAVWLSDVLSAASRIPLAIALSELAQALHSPLQENKYGLGTMEIKSMAYHEQALKFRAHRNEVISSNIANADTPNYKARDLDFASALKGASGGGMRLQQTSARHLQPADAMGHSGSLKYRVPSQPTLDGNTVESDVEQAAFAENAVQYRASLAFLDGQIRSLRYAIKGGD